MRQDTPPQKAPSKWWCRASGGAEQVVVPSKWWLTLDGHVDMAHVYETDPYGEFIGLRNISEEPTQSIPRCPNCQRPIRQHATQHYNRVINRAVIDEMSKRFLVSGKAGLQALENEADTLEPEFEKSRQEPLDMVKVAGTHLSPANPFGIIQKLESRLQMSQKLAKDVTSSLVRVADKDEPARKLYDATVRAIRAKQSIGEQMEKTHIRWHFNDFSHHHGWFS
jgi:hypothetical protein